MKIEFSQWLKLHREQASLRQEDIAIALGVGASTISNWEKNVSRPSLNPAQTKKLCDLLRVDFQELCKAYSGEIEVSFIEVG